MHFGTVSDFGKAARILGALVCPLLIGASFASAAQQQPLEGPKAAPGASSAQARPAQAANDGTVSLRVPAGHAWSSGNVEVRAGDRVRIRAWGRARMASAGGNLVGPEGFEHAGVRKFVAALPAYALIATIGDATSDFLLVGKEAEFTAERDGTLFFGINEEDVSANTGEFDVRVTVGEKRGLAFGVGATGVADALENQPRATQPTTAAPAQTSNSGRQTARVRVSARRDWTTTALTVKRGDVITLAASGAVVLNLAGQTSGPDGVSLADPERLIPDKPTGALVAVIGIDNNDFLFVGSRATFTAARDGLLFLGVNENDLTNNSGEFSVDVTASTPAPAARSAAP